MSHETELKLALHAHDLPRLLAHPLLAAPAPRREHLRNTYFDTASLALMQQRLAVRERQVGRRTLLTVKTAGHSVGGLSQRGEWEGPTTPGRFDFAALVDDATLAQQLTQLAPQLVPVFRTDFTRRSWLLQHGDAQVEVALDQGYIATSGVHGARREPLLELELELKSGPVDALLALAHTLALGPHGHAAQGLWLHPTDRSKAERGLALFLGQPPTPMKAAALAGTLEGSPLAAFCTVAQGSLVHLQANVSGWLEAGSGASTVPDPEFIHQARLALRRLRTALQLFGALLPHPFFSHWRTQWRATAHALAGARDWDVLATESLPRLLTDTPDSAPVQALTAWVHAHRLAAHQRAREALSAPAHALNLLDFTRALLALQDHSNHPPQPQLSHWVTSTERRWQRALLNKVQQAHGQDATGWHALRIALKKHHQAQALLAGLKPVPHRRSGAIQLARAQAALGSLNDLSVAQSLLVACPLPGAAELLQRLHQERQTALLALPRLRRQLLRTLSR